MSKPHPRLLSSSTSLTSLHKKLPHNTSNKHLGTSNQPLSTVRTRNQASSLTQGFRSSLAKVHLDEEDDKQAGSISGHVRAQTDRGRQKARGVLERGEEIERGVWTSSNLPETRTRAVFGPLNRPDHWVEDSRSSPPAPSVSSTRKYSHGHTQNTGQGQRRTTIPTHPRTEKIRLTHHRVSKSLSSNGQTETLTERESNLALRGVRWKGYWDAQTRVRPVVPGLAGLSSNSPSKRIPSSFLLPQPISRPRANLYIRNSSTSSSQSLQNSDIPPLFTLPNESSYRLNDLDSELQEEPKPPISARNRLILRAGGSGLPKSHAPPATTPGSNSNMTYGYRPPEPPGSLLSEGTKAVQIGEDAYFLRRDAMGVSDGVGGWGAKSRATSSSSTGRMIFRWKPKENKVVPKDERRRDPGRVSKLLMHCCEREIHMWRTKFGPPRTPSGQGKIGSNADAVGTGTGVVDSNEIQPAGMGTLDVIEIMQKGYERCLECIQAEGVTGRATCLIAILDGSQLRIANLGDSAIVVVRQGKVVFRNEEMQHAFNRPVQLGTDSKDAPMKDAQAFNVAVEKGDVIIMGSDGLSDNLFDEDILEVLSTFSAPSSRYPWLPTNESSQDSSRVRLAFTPQRLSEALCLAASSASRDRGGASPFMAKSIEEGFDYAGGKRDDISVLVALVDGI